MVQSMPIPQPPAFKEGVLLVATQNQSSQGAPPGRPPDMAEQGSGRGRDMEQHGGAQGEAATGTLAGGRARPPRCLTAWLVLSG